MLIQKRTLHLAVVIFLLVNQTACAVLAVLDPVRTPDQTASPTSTITMPAPSATRTSTATASPTMGETHTPSLTLTPRDTRTPFPDIVTPTFWTVKPPPLNQPIPTLKKPNPPAPTTRCNWATLIGSLSIPDSTNFDPLIPFTKTWRLKNIGTCAWTTSYSLVFATGHQMSGPDFIPLSKNVEPGETIDVSVNLISPALNGTYRGYWMLKDASGKAFGTGTQAADAIWVEIDVLSRPNLVYDFAHNYCAATWISAAGVLPCPGTAGASKGYVILIDPPRLENGVLDNEPALLTHPQNISGGFISGIYPPMAVQSGDYFRTVIGCQYASTACDVEFRLEYILPGSSSRNVFASWLETYNGQYTHILLDLSPLAGSTVSFVLTVDANGSAVQDDALWLSPFIDHPPTTP